MAYNPLTTEEIRNQILVEARQEFLTHGLKMTEMKEIAKKVGIGRSTLYRYFENKEVLAFIISLEILNEMELKAMQDSHKAYACGMDRLRVFLFRYIDNLPQYVDALVYLDEFDRSFNDSKLSEMLEEMRRDYMEGVHKNLNRIASWVKRGIDDGSIRTEKEPLYLANMLINTTLGVGQRILVNRILGNKGIQMVKDTIDMLLSSMDPRRLS